MSEPSPGVQALTRGVDLLEALADAGGEAGVFELATVTASTITDPTLMRTERPATRDRGYATDDGEQEPGVRCVAVPVLGPHGAVALSVSGPQGRMDDAALRRAVPLVVAAGERLHAALAT